MFIASNQISGEYNHHFIHKNTQRNVIFMSQAQYAKIISPDGKKETKIKLKIDLSHQVQNW